MQHNAIFQTESSWQMSNIGLVALFEHKPLFNNICMCVPIRLGSRLSPPLPPRPLWCGVVCSVAPPLWALPKNKGPPHPAISVYLFAARKAMQLGKWNEKT